MTGNDELRSAVAEMHARLDSWAAAVEGVAAEAGEDSGDALADPRLEAAQDQFYEALAAFEDATLPVLGLVPDEAVEGTAIDLLADDFFLHFVIGVPGDQPPKRLDDAFELVHDAGHVTVERLLEAGFEVPTFAASRGELELDDLDDEDGDEE